MAITRAQQAKQLLAQGGRIGFQGGGKDLGKGASGAGSGRGMGPAGGASAGGNYGGNRNPEQEYGGSVFSGGGGDGPKAVEYIDGTPVPVTVDNRAERERLRKEQRDRIQDRLKDFRKLDSKQRKFQQFISKFSPVATFTSKFGPLNTRDFFLESSSNDVPDAIFKFFVQAKMHLAVSSQSSRRSQ